MNLTSVIWSLVATVLAGVFILISLVVPAVGALTHLSTAFLIVAAAALGALVAIPVAIQVTKAIVSVGKAPSAN